MIAIAGRVAVGLLKLVLAWLKDLMVTAEANFTR